MADDKIVDVYERRYIEVDYDVEDIERRYKRLYTALIYDTLEIDFSKDFSTLEFLGNTGSAALPSAFSIGLERGICQKGEKVALLGIGSGINSLMLGIEI